MENLQRIDHPIVQQKLGVLRNKDTRPSEFRQAMGEISRLVAYEATRDLEVTKEGVTTPISKSEVTVVKNLPVIVSIMRAGNGMLETVMDLIPGASVGHIGIYRDKFINNTVEYYFRLPENTAGKEIILLDPMVATGDTAMACIERIKQCGVSKVKLVTLLISKLALTRINEVHPDVTTYCAEIESELDENGYLLPGFGDVGSRLYFNN